MSSLQVILGFVTTFPGIPSFNWKIQRFMYAYDTKVGRVTETLILSSNQRGAEDGASIRSRWRVFVLFSMMLRICFVSVVALSHG